MYFRQHQPPISFWLRLTSKPRRFRSRWQQACFEGPTARRDYNTDGTAFERESSKLSTPWRRQTLFMTLRSESCSHRHCLEGSRVRLLAFQSLFSERLKVMLCPRIRRYSGEFCHGGCCSKVGQHCVLTTIVVWSRRTWWFRRVVLWACSQGPKSPAGQESQLPTSHCTQFSSCPT